MKITWQPYVCGQMDNRHIDGMTMLHAPVARGSNSKTIFNKIVSYEQKLCSSFSYQG